MKALCYCDQNRPKCPKTVSIDERDLMNMMRHAYLVGHNEGWSKNDIDNCVDSRDEFLTSLIEDFKVEGHCGYNEYPCSCTTIE